MKKRLQSFVFLILGVLGFAQTLRPIAKEVNDYQAQKVAFKSLSLFSLDNSGGKQASYQQAARDARVLKLDSKKLSGILAERPEAVEMTFPFEDRELTVEMVKVDIYSNDFKVETNKKVVTDYKKGVFYRGIIKGDNRSVVAFSFFDNDVVGVASAPNIGNVTLGKAINSEDFVVYNDQKLTGKNPFICAADEMMENEKQKINYKPSSKAPLVTNSCVRVYYEICNKPFQQNGSTVAATTNWISAVHNNINTLYVNDGVKMSLKTIFIWETADPYTGTYSQNLAAFRTNRPTFDGDLAHLVNYPSTTSVAYLNSLCSTNKYAYSGINMTYSNVPTYSWTIMAMTHEMGHALGSPHTHACAWNGDSTPIDGCGALAGYPETGCDLVGPIPSAGGTIMSYCHLNSVGINMSLGFGEQPGALIRQTVDSKACLGTDCVTACTITVSTLAVSNITKTGLTATITDNVSSQWKYRVIKMDGTVVKSGNTSTKTVNITGLSPNTFYKVEVGTDCSSAYQRSQIILTEDDWCGKTITDSGGANANYTDGESWTKTFYPDNANQKVKITFQEFDLEEGYDFLTVRNGLVNSPAFSGASNMSGTSLPSSFQSTHATGAITVTFSSDQGVTAKGFKANLSCAVLAVDDVKNSKDLLLSPNPVKSNFRIEGINKIESVKVFDNSGKLIREFDAAAISKNDYNVSKLKIGNYVIVIKTLTETLSRKLIKE
ncbi:M12 family metallo-peptidase [Epilithonimonas sp. JDS]|uniref:M12 family metallo-peptidase n=1 Tax=Epilithonimonas sp. JDS TaxID=2902797 RepID=UPI001E619703|nr:M12 family metallo-peptidase [Epilithonimonas sp. JDS]MCD9855104.1 M12 family metallo-peptidase [Epilithonimonas sp. JDS]